MEKMITGVKKFILLIIPPQAHLRKKAPQIVQTLLDGADNDPSLALHRLLFLHEPRRQQSNRHRTVGPRQTKTGRYDQ